MAEKAFAKVDKKREEGLTPEQRDAAFGSVARDFVHSGKIDKAILGNVILMEAAEIVLSRFPEDHPQYPGQHIYSVRDRQASMAMLAPYILDKPEQKVSATVQSVESVLLSLARDDSDGLEVLDAEATPVKGIEG